MNRKIKVSMTQEVTFDSAVDLSKIESVDQYDELVLEHATSIHTNIESIEAIPENCPVCNGPLVEVNIDNENPIFQCRGKCKQAFNQNMEIM